MAKLDDGPVLGSAGETSNQCRDCEKTFASKKSLSRHKNRCRSKTNPNTTVASSSPTTKDPERSKKKNSFIAYECEVCNRLFKSKESLVNHMKDHSDIEDNTEDDEDITQNFDDSDSNIGSREVDKMKNLDRKVIARKELETMESKISFLEKIKERQRFLELKLKEIQRRLTQDKPKDAEKISFSEKYLKNLRDKVLNIDKISLKKDELELRLVKLKDLIKKKETKIPPEAPGKKMTVKRKSEASHSKANKKAKMIDEEEANPPEKSSIESPDLLKYSQNVNIKISVHRELIRKALDIPKLEGKLAILKAKLEKVTSFVSEKKEETVQEEVSAGEIKDEPLTPEKKESCTTSDPEDDEKTETAVRPEKKFKDLKTKLEKQLVKRSKINSQLEKMLVRTETGQEAEEAAARRLKARLAREATVKEVMRRQEERRQLARDKELQQQEEKLVKTIQELKNEIQELAEEGRSPENCLKKKSRKELRKHLQGKVDPKPSLSMSLETRLKNILELQEEKLSLTEKLEEIKKSLAVVVKIEDSQIDVFDNTEDLGDEFNTEDHEIKEEMKIEPLVLEVDVSDSESGDDEDDPFLEHFVSDIEAYRKIISKKNGVVPLVDQSQSVIDEDIDSSSNISIIKQEVESIETNVELKYEIEDDLTLKVEEMEEESYMSSAIAQEIMDDLLDLAVDDTKETLVEETKIVKVENILEEILMDITSRSTKEEFCPEWEDTDTDSEILDQSWTETEKFVRVLSQDESAEEEEILALFQSGSLSRSFLAQSLPVLGWVSREDQAEFLPPGWFMKMDTNTYMETGTPSFFFITENFDICLSSEAARTHLIENPYSTSEIEKFENHFRI